MNSVGTWLSVVLAAISIGQAVYIYRQSVRLAQNRYSWEDIMSGTLGLLQWTRKQGCEPDIVVTVAGSGAIVGNVFVKLLAPKRVPVFQVLLEKPTEPWNPKPADHEIIEGTRYNVLIPKSLLRAPKDKAIAIVDSTIHTGTTLLELTRRLNHAGFENIKTLCLVEVDLPERPFKPDYSYFKNSNKRLHYPWGEGT